MKSWSPLYKLWILFFLSSSLHTFLCLILVCHYACLVQAYFYILHIDIVEMSTSNFGIIRKSDKETDLGV